MNAMLLISACLVGADPAPGKACVGDCSTPVVTTASCGGCSPCAGKIGLLAKLKAKLCNPCDKGHATTCDICPKAAPAPACNVCEKKKIVIEVPTCNLCEKKAAPTCNLCEKKAAPTCNLCEKKAAPTCNVCEKVHSTPNLEGHKCGFLTECKDKLRGLCSKGGKTCGGCATAATTTTCNSPTGCGTAVVPPTTTAPAPMAVPAPAPKVEPKPIPAKVGSAYPAVKPAIVATGYPSL